VRQTLDSLTGPIVPAGHSYGPRAVAWRSRPSTYVVCSDDQASHPGLQRIFARRCSEALEWDTGHCPFLSDPLWRLTAGHDLGSMWFEAHAA
jgi:hypothetical protein